MKRSLKESAANIAVIGFALFSMLFGAGNVIFPPYIGLRCGAQWLQGFFFYYIADIGLALVCLLAIQKRGGHEAITYRLGRVPAELLICVIIMCIGPMLAIPRTAASTFEMSVQPIIPDANPIVFSVIFFVIIALLSLRESRVVDIIGKVLTPLLIIGLLILIIKGSISPIGPVPEQVLVDNVPAISINDGYQTMDVLAMMIFGILISKSVVDKGYTDKKQQGRIVIGSGIVAAAGLLIVYLGLTYLGVTASGMFELTAENVGSVNRTLLVISIVEKLLGHSGTIIFAVVVALACITTAVALVSACSDYFSTLSGGRIKYTWLVIAMCLVSSIIATFGLNQIISVSAPVLSVVYPPTLFLIVLAFFDRWVKNDWVARLGAIGACIVSLMTVLNSYGAPFGFLKKLPLSAYGFEWVLPALVCAAIGLLFPAKSKKEQKTEI